MINHSSKYRNHFECKIEYQNGRVIEQRCIAPCDVGRDSSNQIKIKHWKVSKIHARFYFLTDGIYIEDFGSITGTYVNQKRVSKAGPIGPEDYVLVGPCKIQVILKNKHDSGSTITESFMSGSQGETEYVHDALSDTSEPHETTDSKKMLTESEIMIADSLRGWLLKSLDLRKQDVTAMSDADLRHEARQILVDYVDLEHPTMDVEIKERIISDVIVETIGYGVIESLLLDDTVNEIMVNRYDQIFIERNGSIFLHHDKFSNETALRSVMSRILESVGRRIDESMPLADARLINGGRIHAVIPPVSMHGACMTIRKFPTQSHTLESMLSSNSMCQNMYRHLKKAVRQRKSILISGGTGTGKTTLLKALAGVIPGYERLVSIEDAAELDLNHHNLVALESRHKNIEGNGEISIRDLVKNALRMRPDRIIVGECRGPEALDMLTAMNTGHHGSMSTLHANSARDALSRLETLVLMAEKGLPLCAIREQIASAINLVIQLKRTDDGCRLIESMIELTGIESGVIQTQALFILDKSTNEPTWINQTLN